MSQQEQEILKKPDSVESYNPLVNNPVKENPNVAKSFSTEDNFFGMDLPEQDFTPKSSTQELRDSFEQNKADASSSSSSQGGTQQTTSNNNNPTSTQRPPIESFNPELNDLSKKDKEASAETMAKVIVSSYEWLHQFPNKAIRINQNYLLKLEAKGDIDLSARLTDGNNIITINEAVASYNQMGEGAFSVSREFKEEVTPVLTRVLQKRGVGMTDEQQLIYLFGKDLVMKGIQFKQLYSQRNDFINVIKNASQFSAAAKQQSAPNDYQENKTQNNSQQQSSGFSSNESAESIKQPTVTVNNTNEPVQTTGDKPKSKRGRPAGWRKNKVEDAEYSEIK